MEKYRVILDKAKNLALKENKEESAILLLLMHSSNMESAKLYANLDSDVSLNILNEFNKNVDLYINKNIPPQHIIGYSTFYGYDFIVNGDVLIPRNETEELVENILLTYDEFFNNDVDLIDVGCGSGCIGITLALEEKRMNVVLTDISNNALNVARLNAKKLKANVKFLQGNMLEPVLGKKFDIIVSNPPYIPQNEKVMSLVKDNEPNIALYGGEDGLKYYRVILSEAHKYLKEKGIIAFEHAFDKGKEISILAKKYFPKSKIRLIKDMYGKDRITIIII